MRKIYAKWYERNQKQNLLLLSIRSWQRIHGDNLQRLTYCKKTQLVRFTEDNLHKGDKSFFFLKNHIICVHQITHIRAATLAKTKLLSFLLMPVNQFPSIRDIDFGMVQLSQ